jgi:glutamate 5-kinase
MIRFLPWPDGVQRARARRDDLEAGVGAHRRSDAGKQVIIANGRTPHVLERIVAGESVGTHFAPALQELVR